MSLVTYLSLFAAGLVFFLTGFLLGGHGGDGLHGGHHAGSHDGDFHDGEFDVKNVLSVRGVVFFIIGFGAMGSILTGFEKHPILTLVSSILTGIAVAFIGIFLIGLLYRLQGNSLSTLVSIDGEEGEVITEIPSEGIGEISVRDLSGTVRFVTARSFDKKKIEIGSRITVVSVESGEVVVRRNEVLPPVA